MRAHILLGLALFPLSAAAEPPRIVTDMPVTASLVTQVLGDLGNAELLLDQSSDPHDFQLRPSQAQALQEAELLIWMGPEMTVWLEDAASQLGADHQMQLLHQPGTVLREYAEAGADDHDHAAEDEHDHGDHDHEEEATGDHDDHSDHANETHGDGHDHGAFDPHAWLDPDNGALWLGLIAERLAEADPDNAGTYRANAAVATEVLSALDTQLQQELAPARALPFVSFHDAYGYFTDHFGLPEAVTVAIGDASAPSAARLQEVRARIEASSARCAFTEVGHSPRMIATAVEGLGLIMGGEISPTGVDIEEGSMLYGELLTQLAGQVSACAVATE